MKRGWILDVDGVLIDFFPRYWQILCDFLRTNDQIQVGTMTFASYRRMRREGKSEKDILLRINPSIDTHAFYRWKQLVVENNKYIGFDRLIEGSIAAYRRLRATGKLVLLSARKKRHILIEELKRFGFDSRTRVILSSKQTIAFEIRRIRTRLEQTGVRQWAYVGDGLDDAVFSRALGVPFIGVLTGISNRSRFLEFSSDMIVASTLSQVHS